MGVVCTSSMYGNPPKNFWEFYFHLKAASENPNKPLKGLQYAVFGNGDETYLDTYMNVPRMVDLLLEKAGARRFYGRGEAGEPYTPLDEEMIEAAHGLSVCGRQWLTPRPLTPVWHGMHAGRARSLHTMQSTPTGILPSSSPSSGSLRLTLSSVLCSPSFKA